MKNRRSTKKCEIQVEKNNVVNSVFSEYCSKTSVHGIGYLIDKDKSIYEKLWWLIIFLLCVVICSIQIFHSWTKWKNNPVIISISEAQVPIWTIPFPAVTICPFNKIDRKKYQYREIYIKRYIPELIDKKFLDVSLLCNERKFNYTYMTDEEVIKHIYEVATHSKMAFQKSILNGKSVAFYNQITDDGLCYTYNSFNQKDMYTEILNPELNLIENGYDNEGWNIDSGYPQNSGTSKIYPNRTRDGVKLGMQILLHTASISRDLACGEPIKGYKISLHNPAESPRVGQQYVLTPIKKATVISVKPIVVTTSEKLKSLDVNKRNCYFSYEKSLRFFKVYTQNNCKSECVVNITKAYCGCVAFYMPRDNDTKICGTIDCVYELESEILPEFDVVTEEKLNERQHRAYKIYSVCDCKPACASLDYDYDSSQADYVWEEGFKSKADILRAQIPLSWFEYTSVNIFFKESQFMALYRKELYNETDFLASCGGLLGIFMGVSFISFMEIIYFFTLRLWCVMKNRQHAVVQ